MARSGVMRTGLTPEQIRDIVYLRLPADNARATWRFDRQATKAALAELHITQPVVLSYQRYRVRRGGSLQYGIHRCYRGWHQIRINDVTTWHSKATNLNTTLQNVSDTLWHELMHAAQAERFVTQNQHKNYTLADFYRMAYQPARGAHGAAYQDNLYEIEARQASLDHKDQLLAYYP